jgi:hypothetical protein
MRARGSNPKQLKKTAPVKTANRTKPAKYKPEKPAAPFADKNNPTIKKINNSPYLLSAWGLLPARSKYFLPVEKRAGGKCEL